MLWISRNGQLKLKLALADARNASHPGPCDEDVLELSRKPDIEMQLQQMDPEILKQELLSYGAWEASELVDHADNLQRILWIAAGDLVAQHANTPRRRKSGAA